MESDKIYSRLKDIRTDLDLTQGKLAEMMGVERSTYSSWERQLEILPLKRANQICNILNCTLDYLTGLQRKNEKTGICVELDKVAIGSRLRSLRKERGLTELEVATVLNTTQSTISAYETGKNLIISAFAYQIAKEYEVSLDWICGRNLQAKKDLTK